MYDHLLLLTTVLQGITLLRVLRRDDGEQRGFALVAAGVLVLGVVALAREDRFVGSVAIGMCGLTVVVPWILESVSRWAFARGRLSMAVRAAGLRGMLMPGSGLGRQQQVLDGIGLLEREGVDAALGYFRGLAQETEDGGELAVIHEQIVSMLFYGQRWDEGIAHYERRFHPGYAAMRPGLALGLLRAYGESRRIDNAAGLLRALEEGPVGADPRSAEMLGQARITFLAYVGEARVLDDLITQDRVGELGMTRATGAFFHGIALARAGDVKRAEAELRRVESLAGPRDKRVLEASRTSLGKVAQAAIELEPELGSYVQSVVHRLHGFLRAAPTVRRRGPSVVSYAVMVAFGIAYGITLIRDAGGIGLLELGAVNPELYAAGAWHRIFTAPWLHGDLITLLFDAYALWLGGQLIEQAYGSGRAAVIAIGGAVAGLAAGLLLTPIPMMVMAAGNLMAISVIVAALWTLIPTRTPAINPRARRSLGITLVLLLAANLLASLPELLGLDYPPAALVAAGLWGTAFSLGLPASVPGFVRRVFEVVAVAAVAVSAYGFAMLPGEDPEGLIVDQRTQCRDLDGVVVHVPESFTWTKAEESDTGFSVPVLSGMTDMLELRSGNLVQVAVVELPAPADGPALLAANPDLARQFGVTVVADLPEGWSGNEGWRHWELRQNGEVVAGLVERPIADGERSATIAVVGAPATSLRHTPRLYASILSDAGLAGAEGTAACDEP